MDRFDFVRSLSLTLGALTLLLSSACGAQRAPAVSPSPVANLDPAGLQAPPVYSLLGSRDRLELTSEQIERLDSIGQSLQTERGELAAPIVFSGRARSGRGAPQPSSEVAATLDSLAQIHGKAIAGVEQTLTDRQRELVCESARAETTPAREGAAQGRRLYGQGPGGRGATVLADGPYVWPWCRPAAAPDGDTRNFILNTGGTRSCDLDHSRFAESKPCGFRYSFSRIG